MKTIIPSLLTAMLTIVAVSGHAQTGLTVSQVATVKNGDHQIFIPTDKIQTALNKLFGPSKRDFTIKFLSVITYEDNFFLQVIGVNNETCLIPLTEKDGKLLETIGAGAQIVLCAGKGDGCKPQLTENGWYCSDSTEECEKSVLVTDHSIFE